MHSSNITLLFLIPAASILIGIVQVLRGMYGVANNVLFRSGFTLFLFAFVSAFFCSLLVKSNNIRSDISMGSELDIVFLVSVYALAFVSGAGFLYLYYTSFLPPLFTRSALFFGMLALSTLSITTYKKVYKPSAVTNRPGQKFKEVEEPASKPSANNKLAPSIGTL